MVYLVGNSSLPVTEKQYKIKMPDLTGKFGLSLNLGKKEIFIGVAIADTQIETVVRKRKPKIIMQKGKGIFIPS